MTTVKFSSYIDSRGATSFPYLAITRFKDVTPETVENTKKSLSENPYMQKKGKEMITTFAGKEAWILSGIGTGIDGKSYYTKNIIVYENTIAYQLVWLDNSNQSNTDLLNQMLSTFQFAHFSPKPAKTPIPSSAQLLTPSPRTVQTAGIFVAKDLGFSINYPLSWQSPYEKIDIDQTIIKFSKQKDPVGVMNEPFLQIHTYTDVKFEEKEGIKETLTKNLQSLREEMILLSGEPALTISGYGDYSDGRKFYLKVVTVSNKDKFYVFTWFDDGNNKNIDIFNTMLSSFKFIN